MNPTAQQPRSESPGLSHPQKFPPSPPSLFPLFRNLAPAANGPPLGNTRVTFRADGADAIAPTFAADYYPYGKILRQFSCQPNRYLSTHHERDAETGYDNRGARLYDAEIGRFLGVDALAGEFQAWSPFNYVLGDPVSMIDPDGRAPERWPPLGDAMRWAANKLSENGYNRAAGFVNAASGVVDGLSTAGISTGVNYAQGLSEVSSDNSTLENAALIDPTGLAGIAHTVQRATGDGADAEQAQGELTFAAVAAVATRGATRTRPSTPSPAGAPAVVSEATIQSALAGSEMKTVQSSVSLPAVERYVRMNEAGKVPPPIKVDNGVIVDGNHRFVAGQITQTPVPTTPGTLSTSSRSRIKPVQELKVDPADYGNH